MRNSTRLLSDLFFGFASNDGSKICDLQIGDDSNKGPPGIKAADFANRTGSFLHIGNDEAGNNIIPSPPN